MASSSVARPVRRLGVSQSLRFVQVKLKQVDHPGKLGTLVGGGGQSEGSKKQRQSGVVKVDSSLRGKVH
jgi:hypothetical protein